MKNYTFVDCATQGYLLMVSLLVLGFHSERTPKGLYLVAAHGIAMMLIHALICFHASHRPGRLLELLRNFYPILLFTGFYRETGALHHMFFADYLDPWLIWIEARFFGVQPSLVFMDRLPYLAVSELFYAAYFSYYIMIVGIGIALFIRNRAHFFHFVSVLSFVFYVCYMTYIVLPVMGPRAFYGGPMGYEIPAELQPAEIPAYPDAVQQGPFFRIMRQIYHHLEAPGAAFPSSHVAIAIVTLWFSFQYLPRIRYYHLADVTLLCASTVYCRYHYVVDVVAGMITAAALIPLANWLYFRYPKQVTEHRQVEAVPPLEGVNVTSRSVEP
jgi:membrane-associated phospholipid phosphatase